MDSDDASSTGPTVFETFTNLQVEIMISTLISTQRNTDSHLKELWADYTRALIHIRLPLPLVIPSFKSMLMSPGHPDRSRRGQEEGHEGRARVHQPCRREVEVGVRED